MGIETGDTRQPSSVGWAEHERVCAELKAAEARAEAAEQSLAKVHETAWYHQLAAALESDDMTQAERADGELAERGIELITERNRLRRELATERSLTEGVSEQRDSLLLQLNAERAQGNALRRELAEARNRLAAAESYNADLVNIDLVRERDVDRQRAERVEALLIQAREERANAEMEAESYKVIDPYATVAAHERVIATLTAERDQLRATLTATVQERDLLGQRLYETNNSSVQYQRERDQALLERDGKDAEAAALREALNANYDPELVIREHDDGDAITNQAFCVVCGVIVYGGVHTRSLTCEYTWRMKKLRRALSTTAGAELLARLKAAETDLAYQTEARCQDGKDNIANFKAWSEEHHKPLKQRIAQMEAALREAERHLEELRDAWERGCISEHDCKGGTRSNRNHDTLIAVRAALSASGDGKPADGNS